MEAAYTIDEVTNSIVLTITEGDTVLSSGAIDVIQMADSIPTAVLSDYRDAIRAGIFEKVTELDEDFLDSKVYDLYNVLYNVLPKLQTVNALLEKRTQQEEDNQPLP